jgi:hypothetical protein
MGCSITLPTFGSGNVRRPIRSSKIERPARGLPPGSVAGYLREQRVTTERSPGWKPRGFGRKSAFADSPSVFLLSQSAEADFLA